MSLLNKAEKWLAYKLRKENKIILTKQEGDIVLMASMAMQKVFNQYYSNLYKTSDNYLEKINEYLK